MSEKDSEAVGDAALDWARSVVNYTVAGQQAHPWMVADVVQHVPVLFRMVARLSKENLSRRCYTHKRGALPLGATGPEVPAKEQPSGPVRFLVEELRRLVDDARPIMAYIRHGDTPKKCDNPGPCPFCDADKWYSRVLAAESASPSPSSEAADKTVGTFPQVPTNEPAPEAAGAYTGGQPLEQVVGQPAPKCPECGGGGSISWEQHDCGGDDARCLRRCPIEGQKPCPRCSQREEGK